jgi:formylglycine-generating enzyme required for sulfatase activity
MTNHPEIDMAKKTSKKAVAKKPATKKKAIKKAPVEKATKKTAIAKKGTKPFSMQRSANTRAVQEGVTKNSIGMAFKLLPGGTFTMGCPSGPVGEQPHRVTLTQPFELGVYAVTQEQYKRVMGRNPSGFKGPQNPVEQVDWDDAVEFCRKLSALPDEKSAGYVYRLPTEAEWEYACRAGTTTDFSFGTARLGDFAWYSNNSRQTTHPVGQKKPNGWGLYDMHGNVEEWCQDWYRDYPSGSVTDPTGPSRGSLKVCRGGCWWSSHDICRSAYHYGCQPYIPSHTCGFRVIRGSVK